MDVGYLAALFAGVLALLSPCGALLLPSFFAVTFTGGQRLVLHALVFLAGLITLLAPLGAGAAFAGSLVTTHRSTLILVSGWLIIVLGVVQIFGGGFDVRRLLPKRLQQAATPSQPAATGTSAGAGTNLAVGPIGSGAAQTATQQSTNRRPAKSSLVSAFFLGLVSGVAGFCSGPILGAVLAMASVSGSPLHGMALLSMYGLGMALPLFAIAAIWGRFGQKGRGLLRGRMFTIGKLRLHTTSVITGTLLIGVGILFISTNGLVGVDGILSTEASFELDIWARDLAGKVPDIALIIAGAAVALAAWAWFAFVRPRRKQEAAERAAAEHTQV